MLVDGGKRLEPCVAIANPQSLEVVPFVDIIADDTYSVIGIRRISPSLDTPPDRGLLNMIGQQDAPSGGLQGAEDMERGEAVSQQPQQDLDETVHRMKGKLWTKLAGLEQAPAGVGMQKIKRQNAFGKSIKDEASMNYVFERLRVHTSHIHEVSASVCDRLR